MADGLADQGFGGEGETVKGKGHDPEELQQDLVGSQGVVAKAGAKKDEGGEGQLQDDRAQHDIAAGGEGFAQGGDVGDAGPGLGQDGAEGVAGEVQAKSEAGGFSDKRGGGDAGDAPVQAKDEPQAEGGVEQVLPKLQDQDGAGAFDTDQPAGQGIDGEGGGGGPDADRQVLPGEAFDGDGGRGDLEGGGEQQGLQGDQGQTGGGGDEEGAKEGGGAFGGVTGAMGLGGEAGGAHPEEAEGPVQGGEDDGAEADGTDRGGLAQLADDGGIDGTEEGNGGVGQHDGQRDVEDAGVGELGHAGVIHNRTSSLAPLRSGEGDARAARLAHPSPLRSGRCIAAPLVRATHAARGEGFNFIRQGHRAAGASGNGRWPWRRVWRGCPATPRPERWHSADPSG